MREGPDPLLAVCRQLAADPVAHPRRLADAAHALFEVRDAAAVIPVLLPLLKHPAAVVRLGAVRGLSTHLAYPVALYAVNDAAEHDGAGVVRGAAEEAMRFAETSSMACLQCGNEGAKLTPDPTPDDPLPRPMFCNDPCAVRWALSDARENFHACLTQGRWEVGTAAACPVCTDAARVGAEETEQP